jgi:aminoglycoside phosphotransferase (APT) family kinase protein
VCGEPVAVDGVKRLAGGASRELWRFTASRAGGPPEDLVLRRDPPGHVIESSRQGEFELLKAARAAGVPVPDVRWCETDPAVLGSPFFVMELVRGEAIARRLLRDAEYARAREVLPEQLARALARIHEIDPASLDFLARPAAGISPAAAELARYRSVFDSIAPDPHPVLELAFRWLGARAPEGTAQSVVHGDFRMGNVLVDAAGLTAVLDWELAHVGDPMEDLGWLCVRAWRFGAPLPVGGLCERERLCDAYAAASGRAVDPAVVHWWEVFGNLKWAIVCIMQAHTFLTGARNVELASLGRRTCETELELLDLLED